MDIKRLKYFISIVNYDFNLSKTSQYIYVSQPTLSTTINDFEKEYGVDLFRRKNGRLEGLTIAGEKFYNSAVEVVSSYDEMMAAFVNDDDEISGEITIGIPPLVISVLFTDLIIDFITNNESIKFNIVESGAHALKTDLLTDKVDIAVLLKPEGLNPDYIDSNIVQESELAIFMSKENPLAQKEKLKWEDLSNVPLALFDDTFSIHHLVHHKFSLKDINPTIAIQSSSWDFLTNVVRSHEEMVTILPYDLKHAFNLSNLKILKIKEPIPWIVTLTRLKKQHYTNVEELVYETLLQYFNQSN